MMPKPKKCFNSSQSESKKKKLEENVAQEVVASGHSRGFTLEKKDTVFYFCSNVFIYLKPVPLFKIGCTNG